MKLPPFLRTPPPRVALEIGPSRVTAVAVTAAPGRGVTVAGWAVEALPAGAVVPSLTASNVSNPTALAQAVGRAWDRLAVRPKRVALLVPDAAAKVSIVRFKPFGKHEPRERNSANQVWKQQFSQRTPKVR